jgi:regulation of enolase protein 1 (concanavalin A-like superfamily)
VNSGSYTINALPAPWVSVDVGAVGIAGSASANNGVFTVKGSGASLNGTAADQFRYVYQTMTGDGSITARITGQSGAIANAFAGVMIRENTTAGSPYMFMARQGDGIARSRSRLTTGGATTSSSGAAVTPPNSWVRLTRTGNSISAFLSTDGVTWTTVKTTTVTMASNVTVGLIATSGSNTAVNTDVFDNVTVVP